jgi:hypothetical protein
MALSRRKYADDRQVDQGPDWLGSPIPVFLRRLPQSFEGGMTAS